MATINNNENQAKLTPDLYDISEYVSEIQKDNTDGANENTLMLGIFGYMNEVFSQSIQNSIIMASEFANEGIATKAKFEKNIIAHALGLGITNINAVPAKMEVYLTFIEDEIINAIGGGSGDFVFDCDNKIYFDQFEFHPDYDIIIRRVKLSNGSYAYTAMYDMDGEGIYDNPISDITNPYLTPPVVMKINGTRYLFTSCLVRQVEKSTIYKKVLSDNTISSKTASFEFDSQLAGFDINVTNTNGLTHLTPVYEGLSSSGTRYPYIWYTYLDTNNIRIKFDRGSYYPRINSDIEIRLQTTKGEEGNFTWANGTEYPQFSFDSDRLGYSNITVQVRPITGDCMYGMDKKTIEELKQIIPKEALSRGSITNTTDLQNYFNAIDTSTSKMYFYKRRDNCLERLYYSYIVMKDAYQNVIPSNTVGLNVFPADLETEAGSGKLILKRGQILKLSADGSYCNLYEGNPEDDPDYTDGFYYIIPYNFAINLDPMYGMYFLTTMNVNKNLAFTYINEDCQYQYIATYINWNRKYTTDTDTYTLTVLVEQNLMNDDSMITVDESGAVTESKVKAYIVFYNDDNVAFRWAEGSITTYDRTAKIATFTFTFKSNDLINKENDIRVSGVEQAGYTAGTGLDYGYMPANTKAMIHIITKQPEFSTKKTYDDIFGGSNIDITKVIPINADWCVTNSYEIQSGIDFFYNYSEIVYSNVNVVNDTETGDEESGSAAGRDIIKITINGETITLNQISGPSINVADTSSGIVRISYEVGDTDDVLTLIQTKGQTDIQGDLQVEINGEKYLLKDITDEESSNPNTRMVNLYMATEDAEMYDGPKYHYYIENVPMIKYDYFKTESMVEYFCTELIRRKAYIDQALQVLEDSFGMDFKFFNTYGPSKLYTLDNNSAYLNRVNITLTFKLGLQVNYDENIITYITDDVKNFIEDINNVDSIHMSNLITEITQKYSDSITFFEFVDMNGYGPGEQHLFAMQMPEDVVTPDLINVNIRNDVNDKLAMIPDINIIIA